MCESPIVSRAPGWLKRMAAAFAISAPPQVTMTRVFIWNGCAVAYPPDRAAAEDRLDARCPVAVVVEARDLIALAGNRDAARVGELAEPSIP